MKKFLSICVDGLFMWGIACMVAGMLVAGIALMEVAVQAAAWKTIGAFCAAVLCFAGFVYGIYSIGVNVTSPKKLNKKDK